MFKDSGLSLSFMHKSTSDEEKSHCSSKTFQHLSLFPAMSDVVLTAALKNVETVEISPMYLLSLMI